MQVNLLACFSFPIKPLHDMVVIVYVLYVCSSYIMVLWRESRAETMFVTEISPFNSFHIFFMVFSHFIIQLFFGLGTLKKKGFLFKNFSEEILPTF